MFLWKHRPRCRWTNRSVSTGKHPPDHVTRATDRAVRQHMSYSTEERRQGLPVIGGSSATLPVAAPSICLESGFRFSSILQVRRYLFSDPRETAVRQAHHPFPLVREEPMCRDGTSADSPCSHAVRRRLHLGRQLWPGLLCRAEGCNDHRTMAAVFFEVLATGRYFPSAPFLGTCADMSAGFRVNRELPVCSCGKLPFSLHRHHWQIASSVLFSTA